MSRTEKTITLGNEEFSYSIAKRRGQRQYALSVHDDGKVTLTIPKYVSLRSAERFIVSKKEWLKRALATVPKENRVDEKKLIAHYQTHKENSRTFITERLTHLNQPYNFLYNKISIRKSQSRWGSCSSKGNLNFDYRILFLPTHLQDYILVHELCHLKEMNHSKHFWRLVAKTTPEHKIHRKELRNIRMQSLF